MAGWIAIKDVTEMEIATIDETSVTNNESTDETGTAELKKDERDEGLGRGIVSICLSDRVWRAFASITLSPLVLQVQHLNINQFWRAFYELRIKACRMSFWFAPRTSSFELVSEPMYGFEK